jgi:hypothetical protein
MSFLLPQEQTMAQHAPIELQQIGLNPHDFKYSDEKSWRGPCPTCGGHRRFVMFTDNEFPLWHGYCDQCGVKIKMWEKVKVHYDPLRAAALAAEQARNEAERAEYRKQKLSEFTTAEIWAELRDRMTVEHIEWWEAQGIPEDIQRFYPLVTSQTRCIMTVNATSNTRQRTRFHGSGKTSPSKPCNTA